MKLSIIIPAHNEEKRIRETLENYASFFSRKYKKDFEIIVVLNGCKDNTLKVVKNIRKKHPQIRYLDFKESGKGFAITQGFKAAKGNLVGFVDADYSTDENEFDRLMQNINDSGCIIASRWIKGSIVEPRQPASRIAAGRTFNFFVRILFGLKISDTQCGAKLFKKEVVNAILPYLGTTRWAFDVDLLFQAKRNGFKIKEMQTIWKDKKGSKLNIVRNSLEMFLSVIRLRVIYSPFERLSKLFRPVTAIVYDFLRK